MAQPQQTEEYVDYTRIKPAEEREPLGSELTGRAKGNKKPRARILSHFDARLQQVLIAADDKRFNLESLKGPSLTRVKGFSFVGIAAALDGLDGLFGQCAWFEHDENMDWCWIEVKDVRSIERREDPRFRGGAPCLWLVTELAEYAMIAPHQDFDEQWERVLELHHAPRHDMWPQHGLRPAWWPSKWAHKWPYAISTQARYAAMAGDDPLASLTEGLSIQPGPARTTWRRLGPKGDPQIPGRPANYLSHLTEWHMEPDCGIRKDDFTSDLEEGQDNDGDKLGGQNQRKRKGTRPAGERASKRQ